MPYLKGKMCQTVISYCVRACVRVCVRMWKVWHPLDFIFLCF